MHSMLYIYCIQLLWAVGWVLLALIRHPIQYDATLVLTVKFDSTIGPFKVTMMVSNPSKLELLTLIESVSSQPQLP